MKESISALFSFLGLGESHITWGQRFILIVSIILLAWLADFICRKFIIPSIKSIVGKTSVTWDDHLFNEQVLNDICHLVPAFIIYLLMPHAFTDMPLMHSFIIKAADIYIIVSSLKLTFSFVNSLYNLSNEHSKTRNRPLKGVFQMSKVLAAFITSILIFSILLDKSPTDLFVGLGAAATVLMLVFKDTIVGLVSGIQLSANDMLRPGDWITMPKYGADGVVTEVNLTTVKVRNWDNTIVTVPPYTLVSDSFQNWRGMYDSDGRRIKRSINIDMTSVRFCTQAELKRYQEEGLVKPTDQRNQLTNITILRRSLVNYLRHNPQINQRMTVMVRQLQPTPHGMPIEIYCFSANKEWIDYENLQSDIFDYIMAIVPMYGLRIFQNPMGEDFRGLTHN